jgi:hypothetical protein
MFAFDAKESVCGAGGISAMIAMHGIGYGLANPIEGRAGGTPSVTGGPARLPADVAGYICWWNRFLGSLNVYKFGL